MYRYATDEQSTVVFQPKNCAVLTKNPNLTFFSLFKLVYLEREWHYLRSLNRDDIRELKTYIMNGVPRVTSGLQRIFGDSTMDVKIIGRPDTATPRPYRIHRVILSSRRETRTHNAFIHSLFFGNREIFERCAYEKRKGVRKKEFAHSWFAFQTFVLHLDDSTLN